MVLGDPKGDSGVLELAPQVLNFVEMPELCTGNPINTLVDSLFNDSVPRCGRTGFAFGCSISSQQVRISDEVKA